MDLHDMSMFERLVAASSTESLRGFVRVARRNLARRDSRGVRAALRVARRELMARERRTA